MDECSINSLEAHRVEVMVVLFRWCNGAPSGCSSSEISMTVFPLMTSEVFRGFVELVLLFSRRLASLVFPFRMRFPTLLTVDSFFGSGVFVESLLCNASASSLSCFISPFSQSSSLLFRHGLSSFGWTSY